MEIWQSFITSNKQEPIDVTQLVEYSLTNETINVLKYEDAKKIFDKYSTLNQQQITTTNIQQQNRRIHKQNPNKKHKPSRSISPPIIHHNSNIETKKNIEKQKKIISENRYRRTRELIEYDNNINDIQNRKRNQTISITKHSENDNNNVAISRKTNKKSRGIGYVLEKQKSIDKNNLPLSYHEYYNYKNVGNKNGKKKKKKDHKRSTSVNHIMLVTPCYDDENEENNDNIGKIDEDSVIVDEYIDIKAKTFTKGDADNGKSNGKVVNGKNGKGNGKKGKNKKNKHVYHGRGRSATVLSNDLYAYNSKTNKFDLHTLTDENRSTTSSSDDNIKNNGYIYDDNKIDFLDNYLENNNNNNNNNNNIKKTSLYQPKYVKHTKSSKSFSITNSFSTRNAFNYFSSKLFGTKKRPSKTLGKKISLKKDKIKSKSYVFGISINETELKAILKYEHPIPLILYKLKETLFNNNGHLIEGIFRVAGSIKETKLAKNELNKCKYLNEYNFNTIPNTSLAVLIKQFLRDLPISILNNINENIINNSNIDDINIIINLFKEPYLSIFLWLLDLCIDISKYENINKMSDKNMAIVIAPNLIDLTKYDPMKIVSIQDSVNAFFTKCVKLRKKQLNIYT